MIIGKKLNTKRFSKIADKIKLRDALGSPEKIDAVAIFSDFTTTFKLNESYMLLKVHFSLP